MPTRDWDESAPIDHTLNREWPAKGRALKVDISDRLKDIVNGFIAGESDVGVKTVPFIDQGSNPATLSNRFQLFGKAVAGKTELHLKDEDGNVQQVTSGGKVTAAAVAASSVADLANIMNFMYPVGSIYANDAVSTNPGTLFGVGTWVAIEGKVIAGYKSGDANFGTVGASIGEATHLLTAAESGLPAHNHTESQFTASGGSPEPAATIGGGGNAYHNQTGQTGTNGAVDAISAHNNLQPYIVKYVWQRTA